MMSYLIRTCNSASAVFRKYAPLYAASLFMPLDTDEDYEALFQTIPDLPSFNSKGPVVKLMRWYAWFARFAWQESPCSRKNPRAEFWGTKMVYEHYLSADGTAVNHVDLSAVLRDVEMSPQEQLRQLKAASGGFKLAHKVMTHELYANTKLLFCIGQPAWTAHTYKVENVKSSLQGLSFLIKLTLGDWTKELVAIVHAAFTDTSNLEYWQVYRASHLDAAAVTICENAAALATHMVSNMALSKSLKLSIPPLSYAAVTLPDCDPRNDRMSQMRTDWQLILSLEHLALTNPKAADLRDELFWASHVPIRLMYMLFERGGWDPDFPPAKHLFKALVEVLPDSRLVEEHHEKLRDMARRSKHNVTTRVARMQSCRSAGVLEQRGLTTASVTREQFIEQYRRKVDMTKQHFETGHHTLRQDWEHLKDYEQIID